MAGRALTQLEELLSPVVVSLGYEFVGMEYLPQGKHSLLRIYIDKPEGVTVDDCSTVSHQVSGVLEVEDPINGHYVLEVSSPGLDRPLFKFEDFERFSGHNVQIRLQIPLDGRRNYKGLLEGVQTDGQLVDVAIDDEIISLPWDRIEKARLIAE
ncbi:Bacterial ribosome SSU maturation protein RimP [hydrothermal vent metagenome]|uniref:Bacterial ribosome SSU maturation protein RimP n=1 Tax=hydrothermal vent metagenome TaxID=652676 RepID=A0A3B0ZAF1_9ZZZZ